MRKKLKLPISLKSWSIIFLIWLLIGLYFILSSAVYFIDSDKSFNWGPVLINRMPSYFLWGILTPLIIKIALSFKIEKSNFYSRISLHIFIGAVFTFVHRILSVIITYILFEISGGVKESLWSFLSGGKFVIFSSWFDGFFIYWAFLAAIYSFDNYRSSNENRLIATELETQLAQAKLETLKMQLQPHFLFNTLNTISALIYKDPDSADEMISRLGDLLRLTLEKFGQKKVTLKEEIEFISSYLDIQKIRYKDRLEINLNIQPSADDIEVPALILQPVVENSIKYGVEPQSRKIDISISAFINKSFLEIEVTDNGPGISGNITEGVGFKNIKTRLHRMYNNGNLFSFEGSASKGTKTIIKIPVENKV